LFFVAGSALAEESYVILYNDAATQINSSIAVYGNFANKGGSTVNASFVGDIYSGSEKVHSFNVGPTEIAPGENHTFVAEFVPHNIGRYNVKAFVLYGEEMTPTADSHFNSMANSTIIPFATNYAIVVMVLISVAVVGVKFMTDRGEKKQENEQLVNRNDKFRL
jgi:hypothetical protein